MSKIRATPADVVAARQMWLQGYVYGGSGWFESHHASRSMYGDPNSPDRAGEIQRAEDLFDTLAEEGAFTDEWYMKMADGWRRYLEAPGGPQRIDPAAYADGMVARRIPMLTTPAAPAQTKVEEQAASVPTSAEPETEADDLEDDAVEPLTDEPSPKK